MQVSFVPNLLVFGIPGIAVVAVQNSEPGDQLLVNALAGNDTVNAAFLPSGIVGLTIDGGAGKDNITGSDGADVLLGGNGDDFLIGGPGTDTLDGGPGTNVLIQD